MARRLILITNDDGIAAQGIGVLAKLMHELGDVIVVAPDSARCSITPTIPVELKCVSRHDELSEYTCSGTPVDCVKLALEAVCPRCPDLIVSGINHGDNASCSIHYSGTMGAVIEGCLKSIPSIGYSLRTHSQHCDFAPYGETILNVARYVLEHGLPQGVCLNVNFPETNKLKGTRVVRMARGNWSKEWAPALNPRGGSYFWLTGEFSNLEPEEKDTDYWALDNGYASVTPIMVDMTAYNVLGNLKSLEQ